MTTDPAKAALLMKLIEGIEIDSADGRAGVRAILREIEAAAPGSIEMMAANLEMRRLGITPTAH
ncbi:hypothetical protein [Brevundimonas sp. Root1423]|uniref:hypothetical protein n=1 Tax=Brevundimonas sp. Root1423 TaxID=1736462 RepID=UPI0006FBD8EC|nr:hypothetical protein [Brevundimonas sp. Root1423]KQY96391.1 hypothetical protein ASD25_00435 [Brevundimonas sp. Root1423]